MTNTDVIENRLEHLESSVSVLFQKVDRLLFLFVLIPIEVLIQILV